MRVANSTNDLKVQAIAGTYVVIFGIDLPEELCDGLLGFSIYRFDHQKTKEHSCPVRNDSRRIYPARLISRPILQNAILSRIFNGVTILRNPVPSILIPSPR